MKRKDFFITHIKNNIYIYIILLLFGWIFFYKFDYNTLSSWDEAWYGSISREMLSSGDFIHMNWNGKPYYDHPPMGFWITAISYSFFGINEFSTRLPSVLMGWLSIFLIYKTGELLFKNKAVGAAAALILGTCVWYVIRVRSGNLDSAFVFFYLLTIFLSLKSSEKFNYFPLVGLSFAALMLTKTLVGASALPLILFANIHQLLNIRKNWYLILFGILSFFVLAAPWYLIHYHTYSDFHQHHFLTIGMREKTWNSYLKLKAEQPLFYLHMGIRKWYYLWLASVAYLIVTLKFLKKPVFFILLWNFLVLYPFLTAEQTQLWHLIPVYIPVALVVAYGIYDGGMLALTLLKKLKLKLKYLTPTIISAVFFMAIFALAAVQIKVFRAEVFPANRYTPDDVDISRKAGKYDKTIFLDDDYVPLAVFYSGKFLRQLAYEPDGQKTLVELFKSNEKDFIVVTRSWALNNLKEANLEYKLLEQNSSFSIVTRK